ncbi:MAG: dTMP kinase [Acidimicrobiia bacterium]|nr:dTMP kinase [Acidimicrobiia bacterium]
MAVYIAFEGGEGSGKSTQASLLAERLDAVLTREPGGTGLGSRLRELLLNTTDVPIGARSEALMMAADRAQHLDQVIVPALASGRHVVSDRSAFSSMAYQGGGRKLGVDRIQQLNDFAIDGRWPDVVVLLTVPPDAARSRLDRDLDRIEQAGEGFHQRVVDAFTEMAAADPDRWVIVNGEGSIHEVAERVWQALQIRLAQPAP